jgi:hypothetical protein
MPKTDIEWLEEANKLKTQRDYAILLAKRLYELSYCGCAVTECTCGLADTKREVDKLELETCEYPLHWGGIEPSENLKKIFNTDARPAEAKTFPLSEESQSFIDKCVNDNSN